MSPERPPSAELAGPRSTRDRHVRERRVLRVALAASAVLHVLAIGLIGGLLERPPPVDSPPEGPIIAEPPAGMRAVAIRPQAVGDPALERPDRPSPTPPDPSPARPPEVVLVPPDAEVEVERRTVAERLAPRLVDPRLWRPMVVLSRRLTIEDVQARVAAAIELLSDSALAETERALRARDWTVEDADGGRWGISPGKLHLGSLTLPLPIMFPEHPAAAAREAEWYDIQAQLDRALFLESFESRVKAIRERRERERERRRVAEEPNGSG